MNAALDPQLVSRVEDSARKLYEKYLDPIARRFEFEASPPQSQTSGLPMVLLLGNHSAGKSSFINYLLGEEVQRTGIAPVDDGFTILTYGESADDKDGMAVVTNPEFAWGGLEGFGPQLVTHLLLRYQPHEALKGLAIVDSPGMIDAADASVDRGYDFPGVVRWFAERADVILFLFDPDKPGTTGETLKILTDSLAGLDHKLLLTFNKVDRFHSMRDFARAYGALCWNLSKAIPRKDLPHVFNTYLPVKEAREEGEAGLPLEDFDKQREEVREQVQRAPQRRLDNVISRLYQYSRRLRMHAKVLDQLTRERFKTKARFLLMGGVVLSLGLLVAWGLGKLASENDKLDYVVGASAITFLLCGVVAGVYFWDKRLRDKNLSLDALFERTYDRELILGEQVHDLRAMWASVRDRARRGLEVRKKFPFLRRSERKRLDQIIDVEVPKLRAETTKEPEKEEAVSP